MGSSSIRVLGIETSCDETGAAVVSLAADRVELLSNVLSSQTRLHERFGGVVPELASRRHLELLPAVVDMALRDAKASVRELDAVAVTYGPGLVGCLYVGLTAAKVLAWLNDRPLVPVHHLEAHLSSVFLEHAAGDVPFPHLGLVASGGHTFLALVSSQTEYRILGRTRDDAAGEAFDKAAKALGLPYPGGPALSAEADRGRRGAVKFPVAHMKDGSADFSFSGLKTALARHLQEEKRAGREVSVPDVSAGFQEAVVSALVERLAAAAATTGARGVVLGGGVAANTRLRDAVSKLGNELGLRVFVPGRAYCTDNGAMVALAGAFKHRAGISADLSLDADSSPLLPLERSA